MSTQSQRSSAHRDNTIGIDDRGLSLVLSSLDEASPKKGKPEVQRVHARWAFPRVSVPITIHHPGGSETTLRMACRNLSRGGIGVLHSTYVYPGSRVTVTLPRISGGEVAVRGTAARCEHRQGVIHEVGIGFDREINVREFIRPDLFGRWVSFETVSPGQLVGTIVHVDPSALDQKIVRHFLRDTGVRLRQAESGEQALETIRGGCDMIVCERELGDMSGPEFVGRLRREGVHAPVVLVGPEPGGAGRDEIAACGCNAFLGKPFNEEQFLLAVAEFLLDPPEPEVVAPSGERSGELAAVYARRLAELARELERLIGENRGIDAYVVCLQIRGIAPALGFAALADRADQLAARLSTGQDARGLSAEAGELAVACSASRRVG